MTIRKVLLISKVTLYEMSGQGWSDARLKALLEAGDPLVARVEASHRETVAAREEVRQALEDAGLRVTVQHRPARIADGRFDLVVAIGGDGTVLKVARHLHDTPLLAVNSSPSTSIGHFCGCTAASLPAFLGAILAGRREPTPLTRIRVTVDGRDWPEPVLNDVLFAHRTPAATSRYILCLPGEDEEQKSSGVWVCTAAGSTGAVLSAGGEVMPLGDRDLQYVVREPFRAFAPGGRYRHVRGRLGPEGISFVSRMITGAVYLDGSAPGIRAGYFSRVTLRPDAAPLRIFLDEGAPARAGRRLRAADD